MEKNESMTIAASYFWSDSLNAFIFDHSPASPTLADVLMPTGLDISTVDDGGLLNQKPDHRVDIRNIGGWSGYIQKYRQTGSVSQREHAIFLNIRHSNNVKKAEALLRRPSSPGDNLAEV